MRHTFYLQPGATFRPPPIEWMSGGAPVITTGMVATLEFFDRSYAVVRSFTSTSLAGNIVLGLGFIRLWISDEDTAEMDNCISHRLIIDYPGGDKAYLLDGPIAFGSVPSGRDGVVVIEKEVLRIVSKGVQGEPGPVGEDIDVDFSLVYAIAKL